MLKGQTHAKCYIAVITISMAGALSKFRALQGREKRLIFYLLIVAAVAAWKFIPRPWNPSITTQTDHYTIFSTATKPQTDDISLTIEQLYAAYSNQFSSLPGFTPKHPKLKMKLYKDRNEMRRVNPGLGWAEAFYSKPYCQAYYSAAEINSYHWMAHEAVHQLNEEVAHIDPVKWLEEGLAEYLSTSRFTRGTVAVGQIDPNTYPVWWIGIMATSSNLATNIENGSVIPLRKIISGRGGPSMRHHFNLYYLHWWTLTHFLFETPKYRDGTFALVKDGGGVAAFERHIGPIERVQTEWHAHVRTIKADLAAPATRPQLTNRATLPSQ
jgi:hypothetical protein